MENEISEIVERYKRRESIAPDRYSRLNPVVNLIMQERHRAIISIFKEVGIVNLEKLKIFEIGCGTGSNLLELIELGATPCNLVGNELLESRLDSSRERLPSSVKFVLGDASKVNLPEESFDIVFQSTVFSSILDDELQKSLADKMWRLVKPGGGVLWYDFTFNNPQNSDVRGVPLNKINKLFPAAKGSFKRVTLAPPIARRVVPIHPILYGLINSLPFLRTHLIGYLEKA